MKDFEEAVKIEDYELRLAELQARLHDYEMADLRSIYREANCWDGSFDFIDVFDMESVGDYIDTSDAYGFMCRIVHGKVNTMDDWLRVNAYGNLESVSNYDIDFDCRYNIDCLADWLIDYYEHIDCLYEEDKELLDAWQYGYEENEEEDEEE